MKAIYHKDFYVMFRNSCYFIPTFVYGYNKQHFLDVGLTSPAWYIEIKFLTLVIGFQIQKDFIKLEADENK